MGIHVSAGVRRGGLPPGSYEAQAAIQRVKELMNPTHYPKHPEAPTVVIHNHITIIEPEPARRGPGLTRYERTCDVCGVKLESRHPQKRYCSRRCENRAYTLRRAARRGKGMSGECFGNTKG